MFQESRTSRDRTARWVQSHAPYDGGFYSPSFPPTHLDGAYLPPPSEVESSHSIPPKMVLRYNDGRPDIPIRHPPAQFALSSTKPSRRSRHDSARGRPVIPLNDQAPEEIRILPSNGMVPATSPTMRHGHARSKSLPRRIDGERGFHEPMPELPYHRREVSPTQHKVTFAPPAQPSQPWHRPKQSSNSAYPHGQRPRYPSQQIYHPHQIGPNGVIYSHSAPPAGQYPANLVAPSFHPSHRHSTHDTDLRGRDFGRSGRYPPVESAESVGTEKTGSGTYYVLPAHGAHGQKVHVIVSPSAVSYLGIAY